MKQIDDFLTHVIKAEELEKLIDEQQKIFLDPESPYKDRRKKLLDEARELKKEFFNILN